MPALRITRPRGSNSSLTGCSGGAWLHDPSGHVGFGFGLHLCVGQHVARLEAEAVLTALARRVETIQLAGPTRRHHNNTLRAWESIPVRVRLA
jgi:cytochrome P450